MNASPWEIGLGLLIGLVLLVVIYWRHEGKVDE